MDNLETFIEPFCPRKSYFYESTTPDSDHSLAGKFLFLLTRDEVIKIRSESPTFRDFFDKPTERIKETEEALLFVPNCYKKD